MPDISMCKNMHCPSAMKCYRFTALPAEDYQWYAAFAPKDNADRCEDFLPTRTDKLLARDDK